MKEVLYKVLVIGLLLRNNTMAQGGSLHKEEEFSSPIKDLIKGGYVGEVPSDEDLSSIDINDLDQVGLLDFAKQHDIKIGNTKNEDKLRTIIGEWLEEQSGGLDGSEDEVDFSDYESIDFAALSNEQISKFAEFQEIDLEGVEGREQIIQTLEDWRTALSE